MLEELTFVNVRASAEPRLLCTLLHPLPPHYVHPRICRSGSGCMSPPPDLGLVLSLHALSVTSVLCVDVVTPGNLSLSP